MYTNADNISRHDAFGDNLLQGLINKNGISRLLRCRCRKDKQPSGSNDGRAK